MPNNYVFLGTGSLPAGSLANPSLSIGGASFYYEDGILAVAMDGRDVGAIWGATNYSEVYAVYSPDQSGEAWCQAYNGPFGSRRQIGIGAYGASYGGSYGSTGVSHGGLTQVLARDASALMVATDNTAPIYLVTDDTVRVSIPAAGGLSVHGAASAGTIKAGTGDPNNVVVGSPGDVYLRTDGGAGTSLYVKESGSATNTGWAAK